MSSSYLESQKSAFKGALSSAASKISNKKTNLPLAPPSPSPSNGSTTSKNDAATPSAKRKRQDATIYSQPENTGFGDQMGTQMHFALTYLRERDDAKTLDDILGHLSLIRQSDAYKERIAEMLRRHPRIDFIPMEGVTEQKWNVGSYCYRPLIPGVRDKSSLLRFLQERTDSSGVMVKDLKDGWNDCEPALAELEKTRKVLVIRTKKEGNPKHVFQDDASLGTNVDQEFRAMWMRATVPKSEELPRKLLAVGQKPASDDPALTDNNAPQKKQQKKRAARKMGKVTNTHMQDILRDFSHMKK